MNPKMKRHHRTIRSLSRRQVVLLGHEEHKQLDRIEREALRLLLPLMKKFSKYIIPKIIAAGEVNLAPNYANDALLSFDDALVVTAWINLKKKFKRKFLRFIFNNVNDSVNLFFKKVMNAYEVSNHSPISSLSSSTNSAIQSAFGLQNTLMDFDVFYKQNEKYFDETFINHAKNLEETFLKEWQAGVRHEDIARMLVKEGYQKGYNKTKLYCRKQIATLNGTMQQMKQQSLGITSFIWATVLDGRERPSHKARNQHVFSWSNPPEDGPPGIPWGCRCSAIPKLQ